MIAARRCGRAQAGAVLAVLALLAVPAVDAARAELVWRDDPSPDAIVPAGAAGPVLLYFTAVWCGPCRLLEREVFAHPAGRAELGRFDLVRLDLDSAAGRAIADRHRVQSVPAFVVLAPDGREIDRILGYRSRRLLLRDLARFRAGEGTLSVLQARLAARPDDPFVNLELGLRYHARQEWPAAGALLARGLARLDDPGVGLAVPSPPPAAVDTLIAESTRALADVHRRAAEPGLAGAVLEQLLARHPDHPYPRLTWQLLAAARREDGDLLAAVAALREAAAVAPPRPDALSEFALAAADQRWQLEAAEAAARQAVDLTGRAEPHAMAALAHVLRSRRSYPEAMLWIRRAESAAPDDVRWQQERRAIRQAAIDGD